MRTGAKQRQAERCAGREQHVRESFSFLFSSVTARRPFNSANSIWPCEHSHARETHEQTMLHHAWNRIQRHRQSRGVRYSPKPGIDNPVAAIGDKSMAVLAFADIHLARNAVFRESPLNCPPGGTETKWDNLDRKGKTAKGVHPVWTRPRSRPSGRTPQPRSFPVKAPRPRP